MVKEELITKTHLLVAAIGTYISHALGGWDMAVEFLVTFMVIDYITGFLAAAKNKQLNSDIMFWGGIRKGATLVVIAIAVMLDGLIGNEAPVFRTMAVYYYISREGLSAVENLGKLGIPLPTFLKSTLTQLNKDEEKKEESK